MNFLDGHLYPENQQPLIITAAPYAPGWIPSDFPEDIPVTMEEQIQKAVGCYEAGGSDGDEGGQGVLTHASVEDGEVVDAEVFWCVHG